MATRPTDDEHRTSRHDGRVIDPEPSDPGPLDPEPLHPEPLDPEPLDLDADDLNDFVDNYEGDHSAGTEGDRGEEPLPGL